MQESKVNCVKSNCLLWKTVCIVSKYTLTKEHRKCMLWAHWINFPLIVRKSPVSIILLGTCLFRNVGKWIYI